MLSRVRRALTVAVVGTVVVWVTFWEIACGK